MVIIRRIVVFICDDREYYEPDYILRRRSVQLIVALPPRGTNLNQKWIKQIGHDSFVIAHAGKPWSKKEWRSVRFWSSPGARDRLPRTGTDKLRTVETDTISEISMT